MLMSMLYVPERKREEERYIKRQKPHTPRAHSPRVTGDRMFIVRVNGQWPVATGKPAAERGSRGRRGEFYTDRRKDRRAVMEPLVYHSPGTVNMFAGCLSRPF